jgi:hypothetical protein
MTARSLAWRITVCPAVLTIVALPAATRPPSGAWAAAALASAATETAASIDTRRACASARAAGWSQRDMDLVLDAAWTQSRPIYAHKLNQSQRYS